MPDITVTDSTHPTHLVEELVTMRKDGEFFDYVIRGSKQTYHIHSLVLACMSPVFKAMLRSDMAETTKKEASFPSIPDDIMDKVIDYAYDGICTFPDDQLMNLTKAAHYLQMPKLLKLCEEKISTVLETSSCFSWLRLADKLELKSVIPQIQKMVRTAYKDVILAEDFLTIDIKEMMQFLGDMREHGTCSDDLLHGILTWIKHDPVSRSTNMPELFTMIPVRQCSDQFISRMIQENADILDMQKDSYKVLLSGTLDKTMSKCLGEDKTVILFGGQSYSDTPNAVCWMLKDEAMIKMCKVQKDFVFNEYHSVCQIPGGILLTGGRNSDLCLVFVIAIKLWVKQSPLLVTRSAHTSVYCRGKAYVIGGTVPDAPVTDSVDVMDLDSKVWVNGPPLPQAGDLLKSVSFKLVLFVLFPRKCTMYQLDIDNMSWSEKASLPQSSYGCSVTTTDDNIFAAGGNGDINCMYTPATDTWCRLTGPSLLERQGSMVYYQQKLYLFPGCKRDGKLTDIEEYDITADKWSLTKWKLPTPLWLHGIFIVDTPK